MTIVRAPYLHPGQREIVRAEARFSVLCCGRRWGKTRLAAWLALRDLVRGRRVWWVAPTYTVADLGWRVLRPLVEQLPGAEVKIADGCFRVGTGELWFKSAERPDNLRGEGLDGLVMDEADFIDAEVWTKVLRPALTDRKGWAFFCSTPRQRGGWFHCLLQRGLSGALPSWRGWSRPSVTNPLLDPAEIEDAREDLDPWTFAVEYGAEFRESPDLVAYCFDEALHVRPARFDPSRQVVVGVDFNNAPRVAVFLQRDPEQLDTYRVVGEVSEPAPTTTDVHARYVRDWLSSRGRPLPAGAARYRPEEVLVAPDYSGVALRHGGGSDHADFRGAGFPLWLRDGGNPPVEERDKLLNGRLKNAEGRVRLTVDPSCRATIESLRSLRTKGRDRSAHGHIYDALGYALVCLAAQEGPSRPLPLSVPRAGASRPGKRGTLL